MRPPRKPTSSRDCVLDVAHYVGPMTRIRVADVGPTSTPDPRSRATATPVSLTGPLHEDVHSGALESAWATRYPRRLPLKLAPPEANSVTKLLVKFADHETVDEVKVRVELDEILEAL